MITPDQKAEIVRVVGYGYSVKLTAHINKLGIRNAQGNTFSKQNLSYIINGYAENFEIENAIADYIKTNELSEKEQALANVLSVKA